MKNKKFIYAIISATVFGIMPWMTLKMYEFGCTSVSAVFYRFFYASIVLYVIAKKNNDSTLTYTKEELRKLLFLSSNFILTPILLFASYEYIDSGVSTTLHFLYPVIIAGAHILLSYSKVSFPGVVSLILASFGILLLVDLSCGVNMYGVILAILSAITYSIYSIYFEVSGLIRMNSYKLSFFTASASSIVALVLSLIRKEFVLILNKNFIFFSMFYSLLILFFGVLFYQKSIKYIGSKNTAILSTLEPVTSILVGTVFLGQIMRLKSFFGVTLIIISAIIILMFDISTDKEKT
ncbi:DMT family transporter [Peptoniphilus catoniae]|uniref:DMT family transporter n=1 Tax=Peptoniphilus catoniae TaxID=1660341 RepID=UPI0010FE8EC1|nr:DMT family transporter [Peptoniphilus catoniae]